jgi:hypothetical protein
MKAQVLKGSAICGVMAAISVLQAAPADAYTVFTDRAAWEAALTTATFAVDTTETFENAATPPAAIGGAITFDGGIQSTAPGALQTAAGILGVYNVIGDTTISWVLPKPVIGFFGEFASGTRFRLPPRLGGFTHLSSLTVSGDFDGNGTEIESIFTNKRLADGFFSFGIIGEKSFDQIVFSLTDNSTNLPSHAVFDDFTTAIPTPALLPGLIGLGVAALRRKKDETAEENA